MFASVFSRQLYGLFTHLTVSGVTGQRWGQRQTLRAVTEAPLNIVTRDTGKSAEFEVGSETVQFIVSVHLASLLRRRGSEMEKVRQEIDKLRPHLWLTLLVTGLGGGGQWGRLDHLLLTEMAGWAGLHSSMSSQSSSSS